MTKQIAEVDPELVIGKIGTRGSFFCIRSHIYVLREREREKERERERELCLPYV